MLMLSFSKKRSDRLAAIWIITIPVATLEFAFLIPKAGVERQGEGWERRCCVIPTDYVRLAVALTRVLLTGNIRSHGPHSITVTGAAAVRVRGPQIVESGLALIALPARHVSLALTLAPDLWSKGRPCDYAPIRQLVHCAVNACHRRAGPYTPGSCGERNISLTTLGCWRVDIWPCLLIIRLNPFYLFTFTLLINIYLQSLEKKSVKWYMRWYMTLKPTGTEYIKQ